MELRDYLKVTRRRWISIVVVTCLFGTGAFLAAALQTPQYASTARLFVTTAQTDDAQLLQGGQFSAQRVKSYAELIGSRELAERVQQDTELGLEVDSLARSVSAKAVLDTVNLEITVMNDDPHRAQLVAQSYAEQLTDLVRELETPAGQAESPVKATIVDSASLQTSPVSPDVTRTVLIGVFLGLVAGFALAVVRELLDTRVKSPEDIVGITEAPTLGMIAFDPNSSKIPLITQIESHAPRAESFRVLRTNLQFVDVDSEHKLFVVTSAVPGEGKTTTAVNLAISLAQGGRRTLLVGGDMRRPSADDKLGLDRAVGLTSVLLGHVDLKEAIQHHEDSGLDFLSSGPVPPNPAELLQTRAMDQLLSSVRLQYDVVLVDAPPLLPVTDAALLAAKADGAILVLSHRGVTKEQVRLSIERLHQVGGAVSGIVLNKVPSKGGTYGYGYGYGYAPQKSAAPE
ncbi:polysaccharide biosynthesis tyrosine autokinase [Nocardioides sp. zg-ZUI104]|uniref:polysaccharide biosynthesis tyrosine autokinase n=1 Tax=Nocardioides faecalis TaxID=2803858 RepID=UPI001BCFE2B3|nr:polysaccharide biosynthesis tyrosine autokinase [Nocardioides faecalis]MBS4753300.1 polysaccharide biosynthesis tyrosine autokinase [Nocardioides faecalis]